MTIEPSWTAVLGGWIALPALVRGDRALVRAAKDLVAVDLADGATSWQTEVDPDNGQGRILAAVGDLVVTDRRVDRMTQIVAVRLDADIAWERNTGTVVAEAWCVAGDRLYVAGKRGDDTILHGFDLPGGDRAVEARLPHRVDALVPWGKGLLCARKSREPGLFSVAADGSGASDILPDGVQTVSRSDRSLLFGMRLAGSERRLELRNGSDLQVTWTAAARSAAAALDGDGALCLAADDSGWVPALRDAATGELRWTGAALAGEPEAVQLVGHLAGYRSFSGLALRARDDGADLGTMSMARDLTATDGGVLVTQKDRLHFLAAP